MNSRGTILLVEDDVRVQINNKEILELNGYAVMLAMDLKGARKAMAEGRPDAVVLDITLPDGDGVDFLKELRQSLKIPVLILTAAQTPEKAAASFDAGGDDYLRKPYILKEFRARVDALMRRAASMPEMIAAGPLKLDIVAMRAFLNDLDMRLTQKEFSLLSYFVQNEGRNISAELLFEKVWGQPMGDCKTAVKTAVSRLRKKLAGSGYSIGSERGEGYCFAGTTE